ncbi:unnamed protein product [Orchesella dallaii]|uniref:ERAP1-like C-terminal domain-containing protein n=1 Tax=Orchesella dallaii TaxID=48710 RepID=A0ABP1S984_9HEXA
MPVVKLSIANESHFAFSQEQFRQKRSYTDARTNDDESSLLRLLPVTHTQLKLNEVPGRNTSWLIPNENVTFLSGNTEEYILVNPDGTGYHRTVYDDPILLNRIQTQLEQDHEAIKPLTRARLLFDYFTFAENDYCKYSTALSLATYLQRDKSLAVWTAFLDKFIDIYSKFLSHPDCDYAMLEYFLQSKIDYRLEEIGKLSDISEELKLLRDKLLHLACRYTPFPSQNQQNRLMKKPYCLSLAQNLFQKWSDNPAGVSPLNSIFPETLRTELECAIVAYGGKQAFDFLFEKFQNLTAKNESYFDTLKSLACAREGDVIQVLLEKTLLPTSDGGFSVEDTWQLIYYIIDIPFANGRAQILPFLSKNFEQIIDKIGDVYDRPIPQVLLSLADYFSTTEQRNEVEEFVELHQNKIFNGSDSNFAIKIKEAFEVIDTNIQWRKIYGQDILKSIL